MTEGITVTVTAVAVGKRHIVGWMSVSNQCMREALSSMSAFVTHPLKRGTGEFHAVS